MSVKIKLNKIEQEKRSRKMYGEKGPEKYNNIKNETKNYKNMFEENNKTKKEIRNRVKKGTG